MGITVMEEFTIVEYIKVEVKTTVETVLDSYLN